jgi:hypothetical protein
MKDAVQHLLHARIVLNDENGALVFTHSKRSPLSLLSLTPSSILLQTLGLSSILETK